MIIYKIENKLNGKIYIGQTINTLKARLTGHLVPGSKSYISSAIKKYGLGSFIISEIAQASDIDDLNKLEKFFISYFKSLAPNGYNLHVGGANHTYSKDAKQQMSESAKKRPKRVITEETRKRMSLVQTGKKVSDDTKQKLRVINLGKKYSDETKRKLSLIHKGQIVTQETREKIRKGLVGNTNAAGRKVSEKTRALIGKAHAGKVLSEEQKQKLQRGRKAFYDQHPELVVTGEQNGASKLKEFEVKEIKTELNSYGEKLPRGVLSSLGRKYNVNYVTIKDIYLGITWKHVTI